MYSCSPKLPSLPGCHKTLSFMCYTVGPCWLSILNTTVCTCPFQIRLVVHGISCTEMQYFICLCDRVMLSHLCACCLIILIFSDKHLWKSPHMASKWSQRRFSPIWCHFAAPTVLGDGYHRHCRFSDVMPACILLQEMARTQLTAKDMMLCCQRRYPGGGWPLSWTWHWKSREKRMEPSRTQRGETWKHRQGEEKVCCDSMLQAIGWDSN